MMKCFAIGALAGVAAAMSESNGDFIAYVAAYNKVYLTHSEFAQRKALWLETDAFINEVNQRGGSHKAGHNHLSDRTEDEKATLRGLLSPSPSSMSPKVYSTSDSTRASTSDTKDWRETPGVVGPVRDEGQCGGTWAISVIETVEGAYTLAGNDPVLMAPQMLMDCGRGVAGFGCEGGYVDRSYVWLETTKTMKEEDYPYQGRDAECKYDESKGVTNVSDYGQAAPDIASIKTRLDIQPLAVTMCAFGRIFTSYKSGVIRAADCSCQPDHALTAVGYGEENGVAYYLLKNQWGEDWGDQGYVRLEQAEGDGTCNMNGGIYFPLI